MGAKRLKLAAVPVSPKLLTAGVDDIVLVIKDHGVNLAGACQKIYRLVRLDDGAERLNDESACHEHCSLRPGPGHAGCDFRGRVRGLATTGGRYLAAILQPRGI
jgi:hypothetical protein